MIELLEQEWSPEQIVGWLCLDHPGDLEMRVGHETIYRAIYTSRWKLIPKPMSKKLRTVRPIRKSKRHSVKRQWRSQIINARRPADAEDRSVIGQLEGDMVVGPATSQVATLVDRKTRYSIVTKLADRRTETGVQALIGRYATMPAILRRTLTWDRGMELANHQISSAATGVDVYFVASRSPWPVG